MSDFIRTADADEIDRVHQFWANTQASATNFGKSRGVVEGGHRWVTIQGLQSEAGKKLNGKVGQLLQEEQLNEQGRHQVQVDGIQQIKLIKPTNLTDVPDDELVQTYRIPADGERQVVKHQVLLFPKSHSMFQNCNPRGNAPTLALCGVPLVVKKKTPKRRLVDRAEFDNQWATWLMIDPISGFAPSQWQSYVGPVLVYRPGGLDLSADDMDAINTFLSQLLDNFGEGPEFNPLTWINPKFFQQFVRELKEDRQVSQYGSALEGLTILNTQP